jgi:HEAT repeat protein
LAGIDGAQRAIEPLLLLLKDRNSAVRAGAMRALARTREPQAIEILASILDKDTNTVYFGPGEDFRPGEDFPSALKALEQVGPAAIAALTQAAEMCWPYKKDEIFGVIAKMRTARSI